MKMKHALFSFVAGVACALLLSSFGCGFGKTACSVVDVVHDNCSWIKYLGPDGKVHEVRVDKEDLTALAVTTEARQAAPKPKPDAGATLMLRAKGWLEDTTDPRDFSAELLFASDGAPPRLFDKADLGRFRGPRYLQGSLGACVAHGVARAIRRCNAVSALVAGLDIDATPIPDASRRFMYYTARQQVHAGQATPFPAPEDTGCYPRMAMEAIRKVGYCREETCPYDLSDVDAAGRVRWANKMPPLSAFSGAYDQKGFVYQRVFGVGDDRIATVSNGLRAGWSCIFAMSIDRPFEEVDGERVIEGIDLDHFAGGHCMDVDGLEDGLPGAEKVVRFDNWWDNWGDTLGRGRMTSRLFGSSIVRDVYLLKSVPTYAAPAPS